MQYACLVYISLFKAALLSPRPTHFSLWCALTPLGVMDYRAKHGAISVGAAIMREYELGAYYRLPLRGRAWFRRLLSTQFRDAFFRCLRRYLTAISSPRELGRWRGSVAARYAISAVLCQVTGLPGSGEKSPTLFAMPFHRPDFVLLHFLALH